MDDLLEQYSLVEVVKLSYPLKQYDDWGFNRRPPAVGDRGAIVDILRAGDRVSYVVESVNPEGGTEWLCGFEPDEIRAVLRAV